MEKQYIRDNILKVIRENMTSFSKSHKRIADYILNNYERCAFYTAAKLAVETDTSESTVVRFPIAIGLSGYPEFQEALCDIVQEKIHYYDKIDITSEGLTPDAVVNNVLSMDAKKIEHTLANVDVKAFNIAVDDIIKAENVYVIGMRSCAPLADFLSYYLKVIRGNVVSVKAGNSNELFEELMHLTEKDVVIGISFPRYSMRTLKALEYANHRRAKVISITDSKHSPMNMYSSCNLYARTDMASIVDSLVAPMSLINALIVSMCVKNNKDIIANLEQLSKDIVDYSFEGNDDINMLDEDVLEELNSFTR